MTMWILKSLASYNSECISIQESHAHKNIQHPLRTCQSFVLCETSLELFRRPCCRFYRHLIVQGGHLMLAVTGVHLRCRVIHGSDTGFALNRLDGVLKQLASLCTSTHDSKLWNISMPTCSSTCLVLIT